MTDSIPETVRRNSDQRLAQWRPYITERLGREPRGLRAVAAFNHEGLPAVIRVASVVNDKPFPTLFWLIDPDICLRLDRLEAAGAIADMQARVDTSADLRAAMVADHDAHRVLRDSFLTEDERALLTARGMMTALEQRGIGGITEPDRIRCLHTWYAAHWVSPNTIGKLTDELLAG